jgi:hypothetical protein
MPIHLPSSIPIRIPFVSERGFNFIKPIRITNRTTKLTDYQIEVNLSTSNFAFEKARSDGADIRFQDANGEGLSYWIESWTSTSATIWVKLNELEDYEERFVYMVYGNYDGTTGTDGTGTFLFFDDFTGDTLDATKWNEDAVNNITHTINNYFRFEDATKSGETYWINDNTDTGSQHQSTWALENAFIMEYIAKQSNTVASQMGAGGLAIIGGDNKISAFYAHHDGSGTNIDSGLGGGFIESPVGTRIGVPTNDERNIRFVVDGSTIAIYEKATSANTYNQRNTATSADISKIALTAGAYGGYSYLEYIQITNLKIRKYSSIVPLVEVL